MDVSWVIFYDSFFFIGMVILYFVCIGNLGEFLYVISLVILNVLGVEFLVFYLLVSFNFYIYKIKF